MFYVVGPSSIDKILSSEDLAFLKEARNKASTSQPAPPQPTDKPHPRWDRGAPQWAAPTFQATEGGSGSSFKPFNKDPEKQQRYEEYLTKRHG